MSTATTTGSSGREQRLPPTSELSAIMFSELSPQHHQEKIPLSYVHIPLHHDGSSSGTSEISSITRLAHAAAVTYGSPPTSLGDVSYSMFSSRIDDPPAAGTIANNSSTSTFRLEPKFGPNTKLRSNPPFWSSNSSTGIRGRKRTAQSMALNNSNSTAITRSGIIGGTSPRRTHQDIHHRHHPIGNSNVRYSHATTPASPRNVDYAMFNLQGLSLRSPASTISGVNYNGATDFRVTPNNAFVASPAATQSSFTACGSSSFSRVNTSFTSTATVDGKSPFRTYPSGSFGSTLEMPGPVDMINDGMPPPASIDISSSSPRIVPLTVLTHDSVPTLQTLASTQCHRRNLSFGSSVTGARQPVQHVLPLGMSPLLLSVDSSSTSDDCRSSVVPETIRRSTDKIDEIFRDDQHLITQTPHRSRPPFASVQYCPDSTHTSMSILADSPITGFADQKGTPSTATNKHVNRAKSIASVGVVPLPKVSLTPKSGTTPSNISSGLPSFPSPNSTSDEHQDMTIALPKASSRINRSIRFYRYTTVPSRDISLLTEAGDNESCSLDLSVDHTSPIRKYDVTTTSNIGKRSYVADSLPIPGACLSNRKKRLESLSLTMTSTPSALSNVSIKEVIIEMDANRFSTSTRGESEVDTESLSDGDDDEFVLAVPSSLLEEKQNEAGHIARQSKLPRLLHTANSTQTITGSTVHPSRTHTSMTSFGSQNTLLGTGYAMSNSSLLGMDASSNPFGMPANFPVNNQSSLIFSEYTGTSINGCTMERVGSLASIGLDLDEPLEKQYGPFNVPFVGRDLITPPIMLEPSQPPALSPRFASRNNDECMITTATNSKKTAETNATPSENCLYYDSTKRTVA